MMLLQQNEGVADRRDVFVQMVDAADRVTPKTGLSLGVEVVKAGLGQYQPSGATATEVGFGTYRLRLAAADLDTLGAMMLRISAAGAADRHLGVQVVRLLDEVHMAKAALVNSRTHVVHTGVNQIKDDDGQTVLRTMTPTEVNGTIVVSVG